MAYVRISREEHGLSVLEKRGCNREDEKGERGELRKLMRTSMPRFLHQILLFG
jgi:hypothetical protein